MLGKYCLFHQQCNLKQNQNRNFHFGFFVSIYFIPNGFIKYAINLFILSTIKNRRVLDSLFQ